MNEDSKRLNKHLALQLGVSRREADDLITAGRITVNKQTAQLGGRLSDGDLVEKDGQPVSDDTERQYVMLNKPRGYVCSRKSQGNAPTIYKIIPNDLHHLKPVGRLDKDSSGLILLTNDGDFALRMTHPRYKKTKIYQVTLDRDLEPLHQQMISDYGVELQDGVSKLGLAKMDDSSRTAWTVTMQEGRNRQIRRTFAALGYEVTNLHRTTFGEFSLEDTYEGALRPVTVR